MQKEDISFLGQLVNSLEDAEIKLEKAYRERDAEDFNEIKSFMLEIQKQISEILK
jgi:hypothetical protein